MMHKPISETDGLEKPLLPDIIKHGLVVFEEKAVFMNDFGGNFHFMRPGRKQMRKRGKQKNKHRQQMPKVRFF